MANKLKSLSLKKDFQNLFEQGVVFKKQGIVVRGIKNKGYGLRVSYGLSKKRVRLAVTRNKFKRWARMCLRQNSLLTQQSLDLLIIVEREIYDYQTFKKVLDELVQKIFGKLYKKNFSVSY